jgi:hypothetical protein
VVSFCGEGLGETVEKQMVESLEIIKHERL